MHGGPADVHPADDHTAEVLGAEVVVVDVPLPGDVGRVDVRGHGDGIALPLALVVAVVDGRLVAPQLRGYPAEFHDVQAVLGPGEPGTAAARAHGGHVAAWIPGH